VAKKTSKARQKRKSGPLLVDFFRPAVARLSRKAFRHNISRIQSLLKKQTALHAKNSEMMAVVKADAYGHTIQCIIPELLKKGVKQFAVASIEEGLLLRQILKKEKILILGGTLQWSREAIELVKKNKFDVAVNDLAALKLFIKQPQIPIHLKVDTGMNRLGMKFPDWGEVIRLLKKSKRPLEGLFTHYATFQGAHFKHQALIFEEVVRWFWSENLEAKWVHTENSGALFAGAQSRRKGILSEVCRVARPGISMYGYLKDFEGKHSLKPVLELSSEVGLVKQIEAGEGVSYDLTYRAKKSESIGVVPMGYADGVSKAYKDFLKLEWRSASNRKKGQLEVAGTICMDMVMVRSSRGKIQPKDRVVFWGDFANEMLKNDIVGPYELNCRLSKRIPRVWVA
jgi:alanine racemase